jgi:hypothetical protein
MQHQNSIYTSMLIEDALDVMAFISLIAARLHHLLNPPFGNPGFVNLFDRGFETGEIQCSLSARWRFPIFGATCERCSSETL